MNPPLKLTRAPIFIFIGMVVMGVRASNLDTIGVTALRAATTNVNGAGIYVAQPEASLTTDLLTWEVNPTNENYVLNQPTSLFAYYSSSGSTNSYPNTLGTDSWHADYVALNFYGLPGGVATNVAHVDNYEADYFYNSIIAVTLPANINDPVVNQSFIFTETNGGQSTVSDQQSIDSAYDNYAAEYSTLFCSGAGNGSPLYVNPPATCYNGIGVGVSDAGTNSSVGPTIDNGRCKPDIIAPGGATSFSTPYISGAAAVLMQAGLRGDGGSDTNSAVDMRTVKALLLNGAIKPADWTNNAPSPLDYRYGAGVLNVFNSYEQLSGGEHPFIISTSVTSGDPHPPTGNSGTISALSGWDFNTISSGAGFFLNPAQDGVNHYYFDVTNGSNNAAFTATITLVWNRQQNQTNINNLSLFLYDVLSSNLVAASTSVVDNVQHIFVPQLPQGRYDLQVLKSAANSVSDPETYALAFEFFSLALSISPSGTDTALSWSVYPAGFVVEARTNLTSPSVWSTNNIPSPVLTNNQNYILLNATNANEFFRLRRP
ncbi:MAG: S8 family serine peptidase [Verrucomicrobiota bacterium]